MVAAKYRMSARSFFIKVNNLPQASIRELTLYKRGNLSYDCERGSERITPSFIVYTVIISYFSNQRQPLCITNVISKVRKGSLQANDF